MVQGLVMFCGVSAALLLASVLGPRVVETMRRRGSAPQTPGPLGGRLAEISELNDFAPLGPIGLPADGQCRDYLVGLRAVVAQETDEARRTAALAACDVLGALFTRTAEAGPRQQCERDGKRRGEATEV